MKGSPTLYPTLQLTVGLNNFFLSLIQIQRNCAFQCLWLTILLKALAVIPLNHLATIYNGNLTNSKLAL